MYQPLRRAPLPTWLWPLLAALLSFVAWQPFVRPDFDVWRADDGEYHLLRVYVFEHAFRDGQWLPRWLPDLFVGYGYPIFNFYAPGTYYAALILRSLGVDVYTTVQALGAIAACLGAAGAFCLTRTIALDITRAGLRPAVIAGLAAAVTYVYAPYPFITNLIVRADLAEALGLALLPWTLLAAWRAGRAPSPARALVNAASIGAVVLTHNLTALVALPAAVAVTLCAACTVPPETRKTALAQLAATVAFALTLTAFFWAPAMFEQRHVHIDVALGGGHKSPRSWLIDPLGATEQTRDLRNPQTPAGPLDLHPSYPYDLNFPPKPSLAQGALALLSLACLAFAAARRYRGATVALFFAAGAALLWLLTTTWAGWAWDHVPLMRFLQFSWRLYGPLALALALLAGLGAALVPRLAPGFLVLGALLALNTTTARPLWIDPVVERRVGGAQLVGTENTLFGAGTTTGGEFVPRAVDLTGRAERPYGNGLYERLYPEFGWLAGRVRALEGRAQILGLWTATTWAEARILADGPATIAFHTVAFPGWRVYVDGDEVPLATAPRDPLTGIAPGFLTVRVPSGEHSVQIAFGPTRLRTIAAAVSVVALGAAVWWLWSARPPLTPARRRYQRLSPALVFASLFALACAHDAVRPALRAPARPGADDARLAFDLLDLARSGRAQLSSPSGPQLGPFLDVRRAAIAGRERAWLYMHSPSHASFELTLPPAAAFQAGLGVDPGAWDAPVGDGMRFVAEVTLLDGAEPGRVVRVLDDPLNPRAFAGERVWHDRWVDLSSFGSRRVRLTLRTEPGTTTDFDWAGWADPVIVTQRDARRSGGGPPLPLPTPRSS
ncbi:MAG TPA: hypothetical protein VFN74_10080 [Chloroflexota bacterium]|nr:hypothetical protein [Chloroflexota bacterium]